MKTPERELYLAKKLVKEWHAKANKAISTFNNVEKEVTKSEIKWKALKKKNAWLPDQRLHKTRSALKALTVTNIFM